MIGGLAILTDWSEPFNALNSRTFLFVPFPLRTESHRSRKTVSLPPDLRQLLESMFEEEKKSCPTCAELIETVQKWRLRPRSGTVTHRTYYHSFLSVSIDQTECRGSWSIGTESAQASFARRSVHRATFSWSTSKPISN